MPFIGNKPSAVPLTSADITDGIITSAKIADGSIVNADINASAGIVASKLSGVQGKFESALFHVRDEKASGTAGGASVDSYTKRTLNTSLTNEISGASISSSVITLPAGTFYILASAPAFKSNQHKLKLRNTSDSADTLIGTSSFAENDYNGESRSFVMGRFTIASSKNFELQHRVSIVTATNGFGVTSTYGNVEVYADCQIWKVA